MSRWFGGCAAAQIVLMAFSAGGFFPERAMAADERPNILFCLADDWGRHAGAYGTDWVTTPVFDRIANEGILFTQAYTASAKCAPSRASILTGRFPWQNEEVGNHMSYWPDEKYRTYIEVLEENGYYAGRTGKGWGPGIFPKNRKLTGEIYLGKKYVPAFEKFLDDIPEGKPFHFWFGSSDPHRGYEKQAHSSERLAQIDLPSYWPDLPEIRQDVADYAFEVERFDSDVGQMLAILKERGLLDNTLVIMTSDHGMPFPRAKGDQYMEGNQVPMAVMWNKRLVKPGRTCQSMVSFVDLAPTLLELGQGDADAGGMAAITGNSFSDILNGDSKGRNMVIYGRERHDHNAREEGKSYPSRAIRTGDYLYIQNLKPDRTPNTMKESGMTPVFKDIDPDSVYGKILMPKQRPADEFYDLGQDPECLNNLAQNPEYAVRMEKMRNALHAKLKKQKDPRMFGGGDEFDTYPPTVPWKKTRAPQEAWEKEQSLF